MSDTATIKLTEKQAEMIDWLMGCPYIERWGELDEADMTEVEMNFPKPELDGNQFTFPDSEQVLELFFSQAGDLTRYVQMADTAGEETSGITQSLNNLEKKMQQAIKE